MRICIPVYDGVNMLDVAGPMEMFHWAGFETVLVAERKNANLRFFTGVPFVAEYGFADVGQFDAIWIPGGDPASLQTLIKGPNRSYLNFLTASEPTVRYTASVCEGALLLAAAGLLDGFQATTHWLFEPCFKKYFPKVKMASDHPRFVHDRNRLTGGGISSGLDEALKLIELLTDTATAEQAQQMTQYFPNPHIKARIPSATSCPISL